LSSLILCAEISGGQQAAHPTTFSLFDKRFSQRR